MGVNSVGVPLILGQTFAVWGFDSGAYVMIRNAYVQNRNKLISRTDFYLYRDAEQSILISISFFSTLTRTSRN